MPRWQSTAKTEQRIKSMAIQTSSRQRVTSFNLIRFGCPEAMMRSSRMMAARYSRSGSSRHRLMASKRFFLYLWLARTTEPFTLGEEKAKDVRYVGINCVLYDVYPVPISLKEPYLLYGSREETWIFGSAFRIRRSNSFSVRTKGGNWGISLHGPTGIHGRFEICLFGL